MRNSALCIILLSALLMLHTCEHSERIHEMSDSSRANTAYHPGTNPR